MKKFISGLTVLVLTVIFSLSANAAPGDLFVQIDLRVDDNGNDQCSILKVMPNGTFSQFVSFTDILTLTGETNCDLDDTGLAVADNGDVYFSEDESDTIIKATPAGVLSTFVTEAQIAAATGDNNVDLDNGMTIGPDGDLYITDEGSDSLLKVTIPGGVVSLLLTEEQILAVTGNNDAQLEGGIAFDCFGNLYISDSPNAQGDQDFILILTPEGDLSIFVTEQEIMAVTGSSVDLDSGMTFFDSLFVNDDGDCRCVIRITLDGEISVFVSQAQITAVTDNDNADLDGGIAVNQSRQVFIGDDGNNPDDPNILFSPPSGSSVSISVSTDELRDLYTPLGFDDPRLKGSMAIEGVDACQITQIPTLSEWGLITMAGVLGIIGFLALRRRMAAA